MTIPRLGWWILLSGVLWAQQQVVPTDFSPPQRALFEKITVSISAPCCRNGVPVAYHDSPLANHIRDFVKNAIEAGKSESQIFGELREMRFGDRQIIFTVPSENSLGVLFWLLPLIFVLVGCCMIFWFLKSKDRLGVPSLSDDELVEKYRAYILQQVKAPVEATRSGA